MAPLTRRRKAAAVAAALPVIDPADRLSKLRDPILAYILSFLPGQEAVRTCVLARTWRHVWKFTTRLLIDGDSVQEKRAFVDRLLRARRAAVVGVEGACGGPLETCGIYFSSFKNEDVPIVNRWIRLAVACRVERLDIDMWRDEDDDGDPDHYFQINSRNLVSQHLTSLYLHGVRFGCSYLDFSGCPALERLEIRFSCMTWVSKMMSPSVRHLVITNIECSQYDRFRICAPRLLSLRLKDIADRNPVLESMPELEVARVKIHTSYVDFCSCDDRIGCKHVMGDVHSSDGEGFFDTEEESSVDSGGQDTTESVLLEGLSQAQHLELMATESTYILRRDLRRCPTFSKLKTLLLDDHWCEPIDCQALVRILEHAPVLEELTVIFSHQGWSKYNVEVMGYLDASVESNMMSPCLKIVKVKCQKVDEGVLSVLKYLGTLNIKFEIRV